MAVPINKHFDDLMDGKTILYVHGFGSSGASGTVTLLRTLLPQATVIAPDLPIAPNEAFALLQNLCHEHQPDLIIGSSMGGMFAEALYGYDRILINPAFDIALHMKDRMGKMTFYNPRQDGVQEFIVTRGLVKEYATFVEEHAFAHSTNLTESERVYGLFGDQDPVVHTFDLFHEHYPQAISFHGEHSVTDKVALHSLIPVIRWIDDHQQQRERPSIFIHISTLKDARGQATSSMFKAVEFLLEHYNVHFLANAPSTDTQYPQLVAEWMRQYINVPAYNRITYTNNTRYIFADYLIHSHDQPDFPGTCLVWGSDELKTWEEIITFFSRLGGQ